LSDELCPNKTNGRNRITFGDVGAPDES